MTSPMGGLPPTGHSPEWLSLEGLAAQCGVPAQTLSTWQLRYGFPVATPGPAGAEPGYRTWDVDQIAQVLALCSAGHRLDVAIQTTRDGS